MDATMPTIAIALLLASEALLLSPIKSRASNVCMLAKRQKASDLKKILQASGVSTAGIVEKEELAARPELGQQPASDVMKIPLIT